MKNNLYSTTAITPPQLCRDPITAAIAGFVGASAGTLAYSLIAMGVNLAVSAVLSFAAAALAPKPPGPEQGLITNVREAVAPRQYVYGTVRKGGVITYVESTGGNNQFLHEILVLAGHEVDEISEIYINDEVVELSGPGYEGPEQRYNAGWVLSDKWMADGVPMVRVLKHRGNQTSSADLFDNAPADSLNSTLLHESAAGLTSDFVGKGVAYLYIKMIYDRDVFANGVPMFSAKIRGKRVYCHGTGQVEYSANLADVVRDYLTSEHGLAEPETAIDATDFAVAYNISNEDMPLAAGGTEKRYEVHGVFGADRAPSSVLGDMMTAGAASLFWGQGQWKLRPGHYTAPVKTLGEGDLRSGISIDPRVPMRDNVNAVRGTFVDAAQDYISADYPEIASDVFLAADGGVENALDLALPFTTSAAAAQRLAKMTLYRTREQATVSAEFSMAAFDLEPGDIIALALPRYGWDAKEFEITDWRLTPGEGGELRVGLQLRETSQAAYAWDSDERDILGGEVILPDPTQGLAVANLQAVPFTRQNPDGVTLTGAGLTWSAAPSAFVTGYEVEWRRQSDGAYQAGTASEPAFEILGILAGVTYEVRVRAVSEDGRKGPWALETFLGGGDAIAPEAPKNLSATGGFQSVALYWDAVTLNADGTPILDLARYNVFRNTSLDVSTAEYVGSAAGTRFVDGGLADNTLYWYWVTAVDTSGNESAKSAADDATTNFISAAQMVADIRAEMGAARIDVVTSLPDPAAPEFDYLPGEFVLYNKKLYEWNGAGWVTLEATVGAGAITRTHIANDAIGTPQLDANSVNASHLRSNSVTAGAISAGAVSADKMAVNDLAAINANLGAVTAGSLNTLSSGTGMQLNVSGKPNAAYIYQNSKNIYALYCKNAYNAFTQGAGGAAYFQSQDGYSVQIVTTQVAVGNAALHAQNSASGGGEGEIGLSNANGGYGFNANRGGYYDNSGDGYGPFTGVHEALVPKGHALQPGDIVCDGAVVAKKLSDALTVVAPSTAQAQATAVGVYVKSDAFEYAPAALMDNSTAPELFALWDQYDLARMNAVGEGCINVCGQGGDIAAGDLIVTSDMAGKGMRQADDLLRSSTVARAREAVQFSGPGEVAQIACIYLCG
ncbi:phage tail protein [Sulfitobacter sp. 1A16787]|uniref:phage tail protein n=1 Tax=Sulfitobacter sp. 1A16787 TaxID=3368571 RepID=UPI003745DF93